MVFEAVRHPHFSAVFFVSHGAFKLHKKAAIPAVFAAAASWRHNFSSASWCPHTQGWQRSACWLRKNRAKTIHLLGNKTKQNNNNKKIILPYGLAVWRGDSSHWRAGYSSPSFLFISETLGCYHYHLSAQDTAQNWRLPSCFEPMQMNSLGVGLRVLLFVALCCLRMGMQELSPLADSNPCLLWCISCYVTAGISCVWGEKKKKKK